MGDTLRFGLIVAVTALAIVLAVLSNRVSERVRIPAPVFFLVGAAVVSEVIPETSRLSITSVERIVTVALAVILFDGGMHIGWRRFRQSAFPIAWLGVVGTFVTTGAVAVCAHWLFGFDWRLALLIGTALAPTDPAVVFSVLGRREISGRTGTLLEGESGANDPVGIALMASLLTATSGGLGHRVGEALVEFALQMVVGGGIGIVGGLALLAFMRRVPLPSEGLYPLRTLACALAIYGVATVAHGSGFLAVLVAGVVIGDGSAPYRAEIRHFHASLASLAEIVAFTVLGLTVQLRSLQHVEIWGFGLGISVLLALVIRPLLVGLLLLPVRLRLGERIFVLWAGLKGAVPVLLGTFILAAGASGVRVYDIIFVVVAFSVVVQGGLVPWTAKRCGVPMRVVEPEPWSLGVRFRERPQGVRRFLVEADAPVIGATVADVMRDRGLWVSLVIRAGGVLPVSGDTSLAEGDEVLVLVDDEGEDPARAFRAGSSPDAT